MSYKISKSPIPQSKLSLIRNLYEKMQIGECVLLDDKDDVRRFFKIAKLQNRKAQSRKTDNGWQVWKI